MSRFGEYLEIRTSKGLSYVRFSSMEKINTAEGIVFDCDGVLIDARPSYDEALKNTVKELVRILIGIEINPNSIPSETIYTIRNTGGFNNDYNTVHLLTTWICLHAPEENLEKLKKRISNNFDLTTLLNTKPNTEIKLTEYEVTTLMKKLEEGIRKYENTGAGYEEIEKNLFRELLNSYEKRSRYLKVLLDALRYPSFYGEGLLVTIFDEMYFGSDNIREVRRRGPFFSFRGMIENEKLMVDSSTLREFKRMFGRMGLATGRGSWETYKTLGDLISYFDRGACVFIADKISQLTGGDLVMYEKPSPYALLESVRNLGVDGNTVIYVGDSVADLLMWKKAREQVGDLLFVGVYGGINETDRLFCFIEGGADVVIPDVTELIKLVNFLRGD